MPERRTLDFARLDDVMPEVDRLLAGHATVGNWSLGQICNHLARVFRMSVEGSTVNAPWLIRATLGPVVKRKVLREGSVATGIKTPDIFVPPPGCRRPGRGRGAAGVDRLLFGPTRDRAGSTRSSAG